MTFRAGLIVGKFCPLHKGHELLIKTAIAACESVVVISYAKPSYTRCGVRTEIGGSAHYFRR